jgi:hypothetical protein
VLQPLLRIRAAAVLGINTNESELAQYGDYLRHTLTGNLGAFGPVATSPAAKMPGWAVIRVSATLHPPRAALRRLCRARVKKVREKNWPNSAVRCRQPKRQTLACSGHTVRPRRAARVCPTPATNIAKPRLRATPSLAK